MAMAAMQCELPLGRILSSSLSSVLLPQRHHWSKRCISTRPRCSFSSQSSVFELLDRRWMLADPAAQIHQISVLPCATLERQGGAVPLPAFSNEPRPSLGCGMQERRGCHPSFYIVRDDLLHPLVNGNKARKLDAVLPILQEHWVTDVVTCGGCQSAHAAAVAVSCAERGICSHLLLRGEQPECPTGYNLISMMYGNTTYIPRSLYAKREEMLSKHANFVAGETGSVMRLDDMLTDRKPKEGNLLDRNGCPGVLSQIEAEKTLRNVVIINEGAGDARALLGVIRLVKYLSQTHLLGMEQPTKVVLDAGTGTTAIGLGLGAKCLGLPWKVVAVMLADTTEGYKGQEKRLLSDFKKIHGMKYLEHFLSQLDDDLVQWVERIHPRKFGKVLGGEIETCRQIAQQTGILVDPVYTLAAWEHATLLCQKEAEGDTQVVMLHTGGTLGMFGLAQSWHCNSLSMGPSLRNSPSHVLIILPNEQGVATSKEQHPGGLACLVFQEIRDGCEVLLPCKL